MRKISFKMTVETTSPHKDGLDFEKQIRKVLAKMWRSQPLGAFGGNVNEYRCTVLPQRV